MSPLVPLTEPTKGEYVVKIHFAKKKVSSKYYTTFIIIVGKGVYEMVLGF